MADGKLRQALKDQGFEVYENVELLIGAVEGANTALPINPSAPAEPVPLHQLRSQAFQDVDLIVLGVNCLLYTSQAVFCGDVAHFRLHFATS